jgi:tryptophan synthase alpha chain
MSPTGYVPIMTHLVAGFPSMAESKAIALAFAKGGAAYLEIQLPFSDPTADGPAIQAACSDALSAGFSVAGGFSLVRDVAEAVDIPIFVMSYASLVYRRGVGRFAAEARESGAAGLIVPDLSAGNDEGLFAAGRESGLHVVPVVTPATSEARLGLYRELRPTYVYTALRAGVTGRRTSISDEQRRFLDRAHTVGERVVAGFGIRQRSQVEELAPLVHAVVVGSALVRRIRDTIPLGPDGKHDQIVHFVRELAFGDESAAHASAAE